MSKPLEVGEIANLDKAVRSIEQGESWDDPEVVQVEAWEDPVRAAHPEFG